MIMVSGSWDNWSLEGVSISGSALSQLHEIKIETIDRFIIAGLIKLYDDLLVNHGPVKRKMLLNLACFSVLCYLNKLFKMSL